MRYELKSIGFWSFTKVAFFINLILGFLIGLVYAFIFGLMMSISSQLPMAGEYGFEPGDMSIGAMFIILPIVFAAMAAFFQTFLMGLLVVMYNLLVKLVGGLVFNFEPVADQLEPVAPAKPTGTHPPPPPPAPPAEPVRPVESAPPVEPAIFPPVDTTPDVPAPNESETENRRDNESKDSE